MDDWIAMPLPDADAQVRRILQSIQGELREFLDVERLDPELIGNLYLRVRDTLEHWQSQSELGSQAENAVIDELALTIYLTAGAWRSTSAANTLDVLPSLQQAIAMAFEAHTTGETSSPRNERRPD